MNNISETLRNLRVNNSIYKKTNCSHKEDRALNQMKKDNVEIPKHFYELPNMPRQYARLEQVVNDDEISEYLMHMQIKQLKQLNSTATWILFILVLPFILFILALLSGGIGAYNLFN